MGIIKQSTYETCLACCLVMMAGNTREDEIEIWKHGWKFNYLIGQLNYVASVYEKEIEAYVENEYYFNKLQKQKGKRVRLTNKKIDTNLISRLLQNGKVIVYLDCYYLQKVVHAPYFVMAAKQEKEFIEIADPFDGKLKKINEGIISKAIGSLRNHLKYSPVLITMPAEINEGSKSII